MKFPKKSSLLAFAIIYAILLTPGIWLIFSFNAFGAGNHKSFLEKSIETFFFFPGVHLLDPSISNLQYLLFYLINTLFWTMVFAACVGATNKLRAQP
ncbi:MAG: hypothetical protein AAF433_19670 [Bacteroidota bacterium]